MKKILLFTLLAFNVLTTNAYADQIIIIQGEEYSCSKTNSVPTTCTPNCRVRRQDGSCLQYDSDFCGKNPVCVPNCRVRRQDGSCLQYDNDVCSEN